MSWEGHRPVLVLPTELADETVAAVLELLYDLAHELERDLPLPASDTPRLPSRSCVPTGHR